MIYDAKTIIYYFMIIQKMIAKVSSYRKYFTFVVKVVYKWHHGLRGEEVKNFVTTVLRPQWEKARRYGEKGQKMSQIAFVLFIFYVMIFSTFFVFRILKQTCVKGFLSVLCFWENIRNDSSVNDGTISTQCLRTTIK